MAHVYSLAYLTSSPCSAVEAVKVAAAVGYDFAGLRLLANTPGGDRQELLGNPQLMREMSAVLRDTGVGLLDIEIIRIGADFEVAPYLQFLDAGATLGAQAVLVAGDDPDLGRLAQNYARLCAAMKLFGMTADLEFMPWTAVTCARVAVDLVTRAGTPDKAGILVDALHFDRSATSMDDIRALAPKLLHYAQICDAPSEARMGRAFTVAEMIHTARVERLLPGEGDIGLAGLFDALPPMPVSVEIPNPRLSSMGALEWARQALRRSIAAVGKD